MKKIICPRCKHEWEYKGHAYFASCPSCLKKVKVDDIDIDNLLDGATIVPPILRGRGRPKTFVAFSVGGKDAN
jgi:tRNA(Ile2) C34 agmatinyltransferase TiaS